MTLAVPVLLGSSTIDATTSYTTASVQAGAAIVVTRDSNTPVGDPVVLTLQDVQSGASVNFFVQDGATLAINDTVSVSAASSISIGDNSTLKLQGATAVSAVLSMHFTGRNATLAIAGGSGVSLAPIASSITGFSASDVVDFTNVAAATSATYSGGTLTLLNGSTSVGTLTISGTVGAAELNIMSDGSGGYYVGDNVGKTTYRQSGSLSQYAGYVSGAGAYQLLPSTATGDSLVSPTQDSTLGFSDGIAFIDPNGTASQIARLYLAVLGHAPDQYGLTYWDSQITSGATTLPGAAYAFVYSAEAYARYGTMTNTQFVNSLYTNTGQTPDASAQQLINSLNGGGTTRESVAMTVVNSAGAIVNNMATDGDNSAAEVYRLMQAGLGRAPGASGYAYFIPQVQSGMALTDIANEIINSAEAGARYGTLSNQAFVSQVYQNVLGRALDTTGQQIWMNAFSGGASRASVFMNILDSPEARIFTAPATHQGFVTLH